ncbi:hypothetical protein DYU11_07215 [Fibrisoma montanum]|uniref:Uncharacterized protein n=1 Tax=Fibrisoma montanum TaxID=2305895 RepID=A0A418ME89_9BACT|nr:hypothetical protein [Fibrisoma montanum]RIV25101.1 hypothetical protein DYU11_07215 [Fibrisoma montanum]
MSNYTANEIEPMGQKKGEWLEPLTPSLSACAFCQHWRADASCSAYPDGIPDRWLFSEAVHDQVEADQLSTVVFNAIAGFH